jgi:O-antigen/teichoic acid export membrane protein
MLATLLATPWVIRLLGPERYGVLVLMNVLVGYLSVADLGMSTASTRFATIAHARSDDAGEAAAIWSAFLLSFIPGAIVAVVLIAFARPLVVHALHLNPSLQDVTVICVRLAAVGLLGRLAAGVFNTPAVVRLRVVILALIGNGVAVLQILVVPLVLFLGGGLPEAVAAIAGAALLRALLNAATGMRLLPALRRPRVSRDLMPLMTRFGWALFLSTAAEVLLTNVEKLLMPRYASVEALAYYSVAFTLAFLLTQLPATTLQPLIPALSRLYARDDRAALEVLYRRALHGMLYWVLAGGMFICAVARPFFTVWAGPQYGIESTVPLYLLIGGVMVEIMSYPPYALLIAFGRADLIARCNVWLIVPYIVVSIALIQRYGAAGAAVAWSVRALIETTLFIWFSKRVSGFAFVPWPENRRDFLLSVGILAGGLLGMLTAEPIVRAGVAGLAVIVYGLLIFGRVLTPSERASVRGILPSLRR